MTRQTMRWDRLLDHAGWALALAALTGLTGCNGILGFQQKNANPPTPNITTTLDAGSNQGGTNSNQNGSTTANQNGNTSGGNQSGNGGTQDGNNGNTNPSGGGNPHTGGNGGNQGSGASPSAKIESLPNQTIYYLQWTPVTVDLSGFPGSSAKFSAQVSGPNADANGATPFALLSLQPSPSDSSQVGPSLSGNISLQNGAAKLVIYAAGYQSQGSLSLSLQVTVTSSDNHYASSLSPIAIPIQERAGFVQNGVVFSTSPSFVDPATSKGWNVSVSQTAGGATQANFSNQDANDATLTIAQDTLKYTVVSPSAVSGNQLPNAQLAVGKMTLQPKVTSAKSQVYALGANAASSVVGINQAPESYFLYYINGLLIIDQTGYYTLCGSAGAQDAVDLVFDNDLIPSSSGSFISIYAGTSNLNFTMNPVGSFVPVSDLYVAGGGSTLFLSGILSVNGNITLGGLAPGHPAPPPGC